MERQRQRIPALRETALLRRRSKILRYCAFGVSDVLGVGAAPVGAAFFFFFFIGAALGYGASLDCWASAFEALSTAAGSPSWQLVPQENTAFDAKSLVIRSVHSRRPPIEPDTTRGKPMTPKMVDGRRPNGR